MPVVKLSARDGIRVRRKRVRPTDDGSLVIGAGDSFSIDASFTGNPSPTFSWRRDDVSLTASGRLAIRTRNRATKAVSRLHLRRPVASESGVYSANGENGAGMASSDVNITVQRNNA